MLHIILLILKILGIILLVAAGLVLSVIYAVLFVAVSYRIQAEKEDNFRLTASASWLFRVVTVRFSLEEKDGFTSVLQIRILGYLLGKDKQKRNRRRRRKRWRSGKGQAESTDTRQERKEPTVSEPPEATDYEDRPEPAERKEYNSASDSPKSRRRHKNKTSGMLQRVCDKIKHIWKKIAGIGNRLRSLRDRKDAFLAFWQLEEHQRARSVLWNESIYLWKKSRPRKIKGEIRFGFNDPSHTGLCMGAVGMLCAWFPGQLRILPDFEQEILKGEILVRGKIRCYIFARIFWHIYFNKDIRHMYHQWQDL